MPTPIEALHGVVNANQALPHVTTGGQPTAQHFRALRAAGLEIVIDIRDPMEPRGYDQEALMTELGFDYQVIVVNEGTMTDATLDRITDSLRTAGDRPTLVHCQSGNRVGGAMIPHLMLDQDMTEEEATMAAMRMGLRSAHLLQWGVEYAKARAGK